MSVALVVKFTVVESAAVCLQRPDMRSFADFIAVSSPCCREKQGCVRFWAFCEMNSETQCS